MAEFKEYIGVGTKSLCINENPGWGLFVCRQVPHRVFQAYRNIDDFFLEYNLLEEKSVYEIIAETKPCNLYFEQDGTINDPEFVGKTTLEIIELTVDLVERYFKSEFPTYYFNFTWAISESCSGDKVSIHYVAHSSNYKFRNNKELHDIFIPDIDEWFKQNNMKFDLAVYDKNRDMRMVNSTKFGEKRPLNKVSQLPDKMFLVTFTEPDQKFLDLAFDVNPEPQPEYEHTDDFDTEYPFIKELLNYIPPDDYFVWFQVCSALKLMELKGLFFEWARGSDKFDLEENEKMYDGLRPVDKYNPIGKLVNLAKKYNPDDYREAYKKKAYSSNPLSATEIEYIRLMKIKPEKRNDTEKAFLSEQKQAVSEERILEMTELESGINRNDKWVCSDFQERVSLTKAGLGKGKTTAVISYMNKNEFKGVIMPTPRETFANSVCSRLNKETEYTFKSYKDKYLGRIRDKYLVIQVESLHKMDLFEDIGEFLIVIDEVESVLMQMTSRETHKDNHTENVKMFEWMIKNAKQVICLDAFLSNRTTGFFKILEIPYTIYNYTVQAIERKRIRIEDENQQGNWMLLADRIVCDVANGKKGFFVCQSKGKLLNNFKPYFDSRLPCMNILYYYSGHVPLKLNRISEWNKFDLIVLTTTITVGCNFDQVDCFDRLYYYTNDLCGLVRDGMQALYRVRHVKDNLIFYTINYRNYCALPTSIKAINYVNNYKDNCKVEQYNSYFKKHDKIVPWYKYVDTFNQFETAVSGRFISDVVESYFDSCNYEKVNDETLIVDLKEKFEHIMEPAKYNFHDIPLITKAEVNLLERKKYRNQELTEKEQLAIRKHFFCAYIFDYEKYPRYKKRDVESEIWDYYIDYRQSKFFNLTCEKGLKLDAGLIKKLVQKNDKEIRMTSDLTTKLAFINQITDILRINNTSDCETEITTECMKRLENWFIEYKKQMSIFFGVKAKTALGKLNEILRDFGLTKCVKIGNSRNPNYKLEQDKLTFNYEHYIKPRMT